MSRQCLGTLGPRLRQHGSLQNTSACHALAQHTMAGCKRAPATSCQLPTSAHHLTNLCITFKIIDTDTLTAVNCFTDAAQGMNFKTQLHA